MTYKSFFRAHNNEHGGDLKMKRNRQNNEQGKNQNPMQREEFAVEPDFREMEKSNQYAGKQQPKKNFNNENNEETK